MADPIDPQELDDRDPLDLMAEEYSHRCRLGENPSVEEYVAQYPELAAEIRSLLPAVAFLERGKRPERKSDLGSSSSTNGRADSPSGMTSLSGLGPSLLAGSLAPALRQLGENRIIREIGRGGMGVVYEAIQEPLGRHVAVKILPRHAYGDIKNRKRFVREAQVIAKLQHPNIVPIFAIGEEETLPYYVMPLIDGSGLDRIDQSTLPDPLTHPVDRANWVAIVGRQAAFALAYAHQQGILHRDIKPANLLLDSTGKVWLADFGLAKLADDATITSTGDLPGTLRYLAPECLTAQADERSDVYSLGLTFYELLIGQPAFTETDRVRLLKQIEAHHIVPPSEILNGVPRDLETIILKATAIEPDNRYATADALVEDLDRFLDGRPILGRRESWFEQATRWCRKNPVIATLATTTIILAVVAVIFIRRWMYPPRVRFDAQGNPVLMRPGDEFDEPGLGGIRPFPPRRGQQGLGPGPGQGRPPRFGPQ
jgi:serine/threonine protein kinase